MNNDCNNSRKTTLSHTFDYGKEVDTSITLSRSVSSSIVSENTFANTKAITCNYTFENQRKTKTIDCPQFCIICYP